jgi:hypothetical protein
MNRTVAWLRLEGLAVLALAVMLYARQQAGWLPFALLILLPDLSMAGYLAGPRAGALAYNLAHTYTSPLLLGAGALLLAHSTLAAVALIWLAHIGLDRALGYGLKLPSGFQDTHLGRIGRRAPARSAATVP